jgi:hypothetical protein
LRDDGIESVDFRTSDIDRLLQLILFAIVQLLHASLHQLQMNVKRVERIPDLVCNACSQQP